MQYEIKVILTNTATLCANVPLQSNIQLGEVAWFKFTVPYTGTYNFYTTGNVDTCGFLYEQKSTSKGLALIEYDDDGAPTFYNFQITIDLTAGMAVYLKIKGYSNSYGSFVVMVE